MRILMFLLLSVVALCAAEKPAAKKAVKPASRQSADRAQTTRKVTVPPGAVETGPGTWSHTDRQGRKWVYRDTPFGIARFEEKEQKEDAAAASSRKSESESVKAFDDGEFVRFERQGPFGVYKWRSNKKELSAMEQEAWDRTRGSAAPQNNSQE